MEETGNLKGMAELLAGLGIAPVAVQDAAREAVEAELLRLGVNAVVTGPRWGCITIETDAVNAELLRWHRDRLLEIAASSAEGGINHIRVRVGSGS